MDVLHPTIARSHRRPGSRLLSYLLPCRAYLPDGVGTVINKAVPLLALPPLHFGGEVSSRRPCGVLHRLISGRGFERSRFSPFIKWGEWGKAICHESIDDLLLIVKTSEMSPVMSAIIQRCLWAIANCAAPRVQILGTRPPQDEKRSWISCEQCAAASLPIA